MWTAICCRVVIGKINPLQPKIWMLCIYTWTFFFAVVYPESTYSVVAYRNWMENKIVTLCCVVPWIINEILAHVFLYFMWFCIRIRRCTMCLHINFIWSIEEGNAECRKIYCYHVPTIVWENISIYKIPQSTNIKSANCF